MYNGEPIQLSDPRGTHALHIPDFFSSFKFQNFNRILILRNLMYKITSSPVEVCDRNVTENIFESNIDDLKSADDLKAFTHTSNHPICSEIIQFESMY